MDEMGETPRTTSWPGRDETLSASAPRKPGCSATFAMERAILLFGCYRAGEANDPETYTAAIAAVLAQFDAVIVTSVTDPRSGIARRLKFLPTVAEIAELCEEEAARADKIKRYAEMGELRRLPRAPRHRANVFVRPEAPQYAAMVEKSKSKTASPEEWRWDTERQGIWVALGWLDDDQAKTAKGWRSFSGDELMAMYGVPAYPPTTPEAAEQPAAGAAAQ